MCNTVRNRCQQFLVKCNYSALLNMVKIMYLIFSGKKATCPISSSFPRIWSHSRTHSPQVPWASLRPQKLCWYGSSWFSKTGCHANYGSNQSQTVVLFAKDGLKLPKISENCAFVITSHGFFAVSVHKWIQSVFHSLSWYIFFILKKEYSWNKKLEFCVLTS